MEKTILGFLFGAFVGLYFGFARGVEYEKFDRNHANHRLQQCLEVLRQ